MYRIILIAILLFKTSSMLGQQSFGPDRNKGWQTDIDSLLVLMKQQHYVYKSKPLPEELLKKAAALKENVAAYSDERMTFEIEKLMYYMHDGHSYIVPFATKREQSWFLPINVYLFNDGVYIINAEEPYTNLVGFRVKEINGTDITKILADMNSYVHQDNKYTVKWFAPTVMRFRGLYEAYGLKALAKDISFKLVNRSGLTVNKTIAFVPTFGLRGIPKLIPSKLATTPPPLYLSDVPANFWLKKFPKKSLLYFQFNQVEDTDAETLEQFSSRLDSTMMAFKPKLFVIDVRHNNGGNMDLLPPLMNVIKKFEAANRTAHIIVITGRNTFSAAQVFISLVNKDTKALFAGEPSSSSPNFVGEEGNEFMLPFSGAMGNISNKYHESIPGDKRKWIDPNYSITLSSKEYFENRDPVMKFILNKFGH